MNLIKYFLQMDEKASMFNFREGKFYSNCNEEFFKIKAFRLEPYGNRLGKYSIDGEVKIKIKI